MQGRRPPCSQPPAVLRLGPRSVQPCKGIALGPAAGFSALGAAVQRSSSDLLMTPGTAGHSEVPVRGLTLWQVHKPLSAPFWFPPGHQESRSLGHWSKPLSCFLSLCRCHFCSHGLYAVEVGPWVPKAQGTGEGMGSIPFDLWTFFLSPFLGQPGLPGPWVPRNRQYIPSPFFSPDVPPASSSSPFFCHILCPG